MEERRPTVLALTFLSVVRLAVNTSIRFVFPFLPAIARGLGVSLERAGLLISARALAALATPALVRLGGPGERRVRLIAWSLALFVAGAALSAVSPRYLGVLLGFVLLGLAKPAFDVGAQAYLADRTPYRLRARYLTVTELTWAGALLLGAPAAGWLIARYDWRAPFWALAACGLLALALLWVAVERDPPGPRPDTPRGPLPASAWPLLGVMALFSFSADATFVVFGAWLEGSFGLSLLALGAASLVAGLAELTGEGAVLAFTDRLGKRRAVALGLVVATAGYAALPLAGTRLGTGMAALALALAGFELTVVSAVPLATEVVPAARSRFLALAMVALGLGRAAAAAVGPAIFGRVGLTGNAVLSAAVNLLALGLLLTRVRED